MARDFDFNRRALDELVRRGDVAEEVARAALQVRNRARGNASAISRSLSEAIEVETGTDGDGAYADVGYLKSAPGFVLWWHEVGTRKYPATPHLRPALRPGP